MFLATELCHKKSSPSRLWHPWPWRHSNSIGHLAAGCCGKHCYWLLIHVFHILLDSSEKSGYLFGRNAMNPGFHHVKIISMEINHMVWWWLKSTKIRNPNASRIITPFLRLIFSWFTCKSGIIRLNARASMLAGSSDCKVLLAGIMSWNTQNMNNNKSNNKSLDFSVISIRAPQKIVGRPIISLCHSWGVSVQNCGSCRNIIACCSCWSIDLSILESSFTIGDPS